jgi:transcriptional regulator with XRE-family HTH domain
MGAGAVFAIFKMGSKLLQKLGRKPYRDAYVGEHVRRGVAYQIRALRDQRGWNQGEFSAALGKPQSVVSRLEDPGYGKLTIQTLLKIASVFDLAIQVRFVSYSSFLRQTQDVSTSSMHVPSFDDDPGIRQSPAFAGRIAMVATETDNSIRFEGSSGSSASMFVPEMRADPKSSMMVFNVH